MIIENGIQPNCSELIMRLPELTNNEIKNKLKKHDIIEVLYQDRWDKAEDEWDVDEFMVPTDKAPDRWIELYNIHQLASTSLELERCAKEFKKETGVELMQVHKMLLEKGKKPAEYGSMLWISDYKGSCIYYHQHCQPQGFPLIKKVSDIFHVEVEGDDGGSSLEYEVWLENQGIYDQPETENYN